MPLSFLLDEHLRGRLWHAVGRHNAAGGLRLDVVRVGDMPDLPLGSPDPAVLAWAETQNRILISSDRRTMPICFRAHLVAGHHSPGVILLSSPFKPLEGVGELELIA
jgi:hypothetical protein